MNTLYWLTVLGNIGSFSAVGVGFFIAVCIISLLQKMVDDDKNLIKQKSQDRKPILTFKKLNYHDDNAKLDKKVCKASIIGMFVSLTLCVLVPSKKELYAIYGIGSVLDYAKSSKEVKKLPDNAVKALNVYLENIQKRDTVSK